MDNLLIILADKATKHMYWRANYHSPIFEKLINEETEHMNKVEVIKNIASEADVTCKVAETVLDTYGKFVIGILDKNRDEKITLPGLGAFSVKHVSERSGVAALAGGKEWTKPAHDEIQFKITKSVKEL